LNSNLHAESPVNLIRIILEGVREPASRELGFMPSFKDNLTDQQLAQIISYMRQRFAPEQSPWDNIEQSIQLVRKSIEH
jgi:nicotinate dehydrogenase subunit B